MTTKASKNITISNNAVLEMYATNNAGFGYLFAGGWKSLTWSGGTIKIDFLVGGWGGGNSPRGGLGAFGNHLFTINSNLVLLIQKMKKEVVGDQMQFLPLVRIAAAS